MKINYSKYLWVLLFVIKQEPSFSQKSNDSLKEILSSKTFTLEEEYNGDWGGYVHIFTFIVEDDNVKIKCENGEISEKMKKQEKLLPISELKKFEQFFLNCNTAIKTSKKASTEHIIYRFKNKNLTYIVDDRTTMECDQDFKKWKKIVFNK